MRLNNDTGERIPTILMNIPDSVEVVRANNSVFTLGQKNVVTLLRKEIKKWLGHPEVGLTTKILTSVTQRGNDMALP